jgi:hypothetical protein
VGAHLAAAAAIVSLGAALLILPTAPTAAPHEPRAVEAPIRLEPKFKTKILIKTGPDAELATSVPTAGAGPAS